MLRTMVFIDYSNFNSELQRHYNITGKPHRNVNYNKLAYAINKKIRIKSELIKTYLFAPKPCALLMMLPQQKTYYEWLCQLKNVSYFEVIEGRTEIRSIPSVNIDIYDSTTYVKEEKGVDVNLATHMLSKGFQNAYDVAILISGDTDYIPVVETLHHLGKTVILATLPHQNASKYDGCRDAHIKIFDDILESC